MSLLIRVLRVFGSLLLRALLLLVILFAAHLLVSRVLPELQDVARAIEEAPVVAEELRLLERALEQDLAGTQQLEHQLGVLGQRKLSELEQRLRDIQHQLSEVRDQREVLLGQIEALEREREEYCSSYNPLKRWACGRLEQRLEALVLRLAPFLETLKEKSAAVEQANLRTREQLRIARDPNLSPAEKLETLGVSEGSITALQLVQARQRIVRLRTDIATLKQDLEKIDQLQGTVSAWLFNEWKAVGVPLVLLAALVLLTPYAQRVISYFLLMPLVSRISAPLQLAGGKHSGQVNYGSPKRSLMLRLALGEVLRVRSEYARPVQGEMRSQLLYKWRAPFVSYAAGLRLLTRIEHTEACRSAQLAGAPADQKGTFSEVTLAAPKEPNTFLMTVELKQHPGFIIYPKHLIGVIGEPELKTKWCLFSLHAWSTFQLRYILLAGSGTAIIEGNGDIITTIPQHRPTKIEQELSIGFDSRLNYSTSRTEVFLPYFFGKTALVDDQFEGEGCFLWQKSEPRSRSNPLARSFDALFSAIGKLLGF